MLKFTVEHILLQMSVRSLTLINPTGTVMASKGGIKLISRWPDDLFEYDFFGVLSVRSQEFKYFLCNVGRVIGVDLDCILQTLRLMVRDPLYEPEAEERILFCARGYEQRAQISFMNNINLKREIDFERPQYGAIGKYLRESQREYCVVAAVPSWEFRHILTLLFSIGIEVNITITETEVVFSEPVQGRCCVLRKELSECIIRATSVEDYPAQVKMVIDCSTQFLLASYLSSMVWILHCADPRAHHLFKFSVGEAGGNLMLYVP